MCANVKNHHDETAFALLAIAMMTAAVGCAASSDDGADSTDSDLKKGTTDQWVYDGLVPHLENINITVSLSAHTARVTGDLPDGFDGDLPYYVETLDKDGGKKEATIVYPIATGAEVNSQGSHYEINSISPWVPTDAHATWGGFPFIPYNHGIAFHGPITFEDGQWKLIRGPVSHGCNRMKGEHVTELANILGANMTTKVHTAQVTGLDVPVTVIHTTDTWNGMQVDVDYPALPQVKRPTGANVKMFKAWSADQLQTYVCALNKADVSNGVIPQGYCSKHLTNTIDPLTGQ